MNLKERERKVDLNLMSAPEIDVLSIQLGNKMREICDEAAQKANALLNIYGMNAKIAIAFDTLPDQMKHMVETPKKKRVRRKKSNLKEEPQG